MKDKKGIYILLLSSLGQKIIHLFSFSSMNVSEIGHYSDRLIAWACGGACWMGILGACLALQSKYNVETLNPDLGVCTLYIKLL